MGTSQGRVGRPDLAGSFPILQTEILEGGAMSDEPNELPAEEQPQNTISEENVGKTYHRKGPSYPDRVRP